MQNYNLRNDSYKELARIGRKYYGDTNFCTVIATAKACRCSFGKAFNELKRQGRKTGKGSWGAPKAITAISGKEVVPYSAVPSMSEKVGCTIGQAEKNLPKKGTFLLHVRGHIACMVDGTLYDWSARSERNGRACRKRIISIDKVKEV